MTRPGREHLVLLAFAGTGLAVVGGVCGYFGTDFGYHLWLAARCATPECAVTETPPWLPVLGGVAGGCAYVGLGLLAGLPFWQRAPEPVIPPDPPGWRERTAAALAHLGICGLPLLIAAVLVLIGSRGTPFLRRHGVAALRLQLWLILVLLPTPFLVMLTVGVYIGVILVAMVGGLGYALLGAYRAGTGDEHAYPADWPARGRPVPAPADPEVREQRALWALAALVALILLRLVYAWLR